MLLALVNGSIFVFLLLKGVQTFHYLLIQIFLVGISSFPRNRDVRANFAWPSFFDGYAKRPPEDMDDSFFLGQAEETLQQNIPVL